MNTISDLFGSVVTLLNTFFKFVFMFSPLFFKFKDMLPYIEIWRVERGLR
jgi:hypothetical protein